MNKADVLARIDSVLVRGQQTIDSAGAAPARPPYPGYSHDNAWVDSGIASGFRTAGLQLLDSLYGTDSTEFEDFDEDTDDKRVLVRYKKAQAQLEAVREQVDQGWFYETRALIAADVFNDLMEMAEYLISEGYKDAAAVLTGSSLEAHLKSLCISHRIDTHNADRTGKQVPKKADTINADLYKSGAYSNGDQKNVIAWLGLRNDAAHGDINKYTLDQVRIMWDGVKDFLTRVPA